MRVFENLLKRQQTLTNQTSGPMENYTRAVKNSTGARESRGEGPWPGADHANSGERSGWVFKICTTRSRIWGDFI